MEPIARLNAALEGRYRIEREVGEGAMAKVYLADDLKHDRKVALKVLKPELAAAVGAERFLAEIKTTANLHHPHILPLFDSGEADRFLFYVMPYVDGESLRDRLDRERQLPVNDAVRIATNLGEALDYAHRQGVIHRDIKPGNVLMQAGKPVISDFGIALALDVRDGGRMTEAGFTLGSPHYMSAEQVTGDLPVGPASDTYALACVVYELLVGEPPHTGPSVQAIFSKTLVGTITPPRERRPATPPNVDAAVRKALERLPADRFPSAGAFAQALDEPSFRYGTDGPVTDASAVRRWQIVAGAMTAVALAAFFLALGSNREPDETTAVERFSSPFAAGEEPRFAEPGAFGLSPDGSFLVYRGARDASGTTQLWVRRWSDLRASRLLPEGQERGGWPTVSPDGQEVAFSVGPNECADAWAITTATSGPHLSADPCRVVVASIAGGPTRELTLGTRPVWATDGYVYASTSAGTVRVHASGGEAEQVTRLGQRETAHAVGDLVEASGQLLLHVRVSGGEPEIRSVDPESGEMTTLTRGSHPRYLVPGYLLFLTADLTLTGARFDARAMEIVGPEVPLVAGVTSYSVSDDGKLFYSSGLVGTTYEFVWVDRFGRASPIDPGWVFNPGTGNFGWSLSPDGTRLAVRATTPAGLDIWIKELDEGPYRRLTLDEAQDWGPRWASNSTVTFLSDRNGDRDVYARAADGTGSVELVWDDDRRVTEAHFSPDGTWLVMRSGEASSAAGTRDIYAVAINDPATRRSIDQPFDEASPNLSPDGRWLAYISNEGGRYEVFVRPFPEVNARKVQVSVDGGWMPLWAHSGRELFFVSERREMVAAEIDISSGFRILRRRVLFTIPAGSPRPASGILHWIDPADERFLMARPVQEGDWSFVLVNDFSAEVRRLVN